MNTASNPASSGRTDLRKYLHSALLVKQIPNIGQSLVVTSFVSLVSVQARKIVDFGNLGRYENDFVIISLYRKSKGNASKIFVQF